MARPRVGGVEGLWSYALSDRRVDDYARAMAKMARLLGRRAWTEKIDRAFTGDTLIRTESVRQIHIPDINIYEDEYIRRYVEHRGFKWLRTPEVVCDHLRTYNLKEAYEAGKYAHYFGELSLSKQIKRLAQLPVKFTFSVAYTRNLRTGTFAVKREIRVFEGFIHAYAQESGRLRFSSSPE